MTHRNASLITLLILSLLVACSRAATPGQWNLPGGTPFVFMHYMAWFSTDTPIEGKKWEHWSNPGAHGHDATKILPNGRRDVASVLYPLIGPYFSLDAALIHYHLATMKAAGVSGIIVDWYGHGHSTDDAMPLLLAEAQKLDMRVAICFEEKEFTNWMNPKNRQEMIDNVVNGLTYAMDKYTSNPAYLRRNGIPFMAQFDSWGDGPNGKMYLSPDEWKIVFSRLPGKLEYCKQNLVPGYAPTIPAAFIWWNEGPASKSFAAEASQLRDQGKLDFFVSMMGVGFNDTGVWGWGDGPRVSKTYGLSVEKHLESYATLGGPELIQCVTWNDFNEGTCFEPTVQYGFTFINELSRFIHKIHGGTVDLDAIQKPYHQYMRENSGR